ncbi:MAG: NAD(P)-dependent alcohol dehydrogenase [Vicinamibacterales bacterium]
MKAIRYRCYGSADVLTLDDVEVPRPAKNEMLVRVRAAALNPLDWHFMHGTPYFMRIAAGIGRPSVTALGVDFAGTVEAVGSEVTTYEPGDDVFGGRTGALAEYLVVRADRAVVRKPVEMSFAQAAAVPVAAVTALQAVRDKGHVRAAQRVLINGASGGVGTFAVQIAKAFGAEVTGVSSTKNLDLVRSLGADHVVDYTREDFTAGPLRYDVILDAVGNRSASELRRALTPDGICVLVGGGGPDDGLLGPIPSVLWATAYSRFVSQSFVPILSELNARDLEVLRDLMQRRAVTPVVDRTYSLAETADAMRYLEAGHARGKVVVTVGPASAETSR